jgi:O-antigen ligase
VAAGLLWFLWQWLAAIGSVHPPTTKTVLLHFSACAACFAAGYLGLSAVNRLQWFWAPLSLAFTWNLWVGLNQHFGGLDAVRDWVYSQPDWSALPPDYLKRISSNRIFSGFVYPNAFANSLLLFLPVLSVWLWGATEKLPRLMRGVACGLLVYAGLACLYWTGSKAAWLIALCIAALAVWMGMDRSKTQLLLAVGIVLVGLVVFSFRFADYFRRGAPSVGARTDYWTVAVNVALEKPWFGAGPGTFYELYRQRKRPEAEMTRLVHNDYLQQACDSGWVGFASYLVFILGAVVELYRKRQHDIVFSALLLGCVGWVIHGFAEFGLYIPGLAWPFFACFGLLLGQSQRFGSTEIRLPA